MSDQISSATNDGKNTLTSNLMEQVTYDELKESMAELNARGKSIVSEEQKLHVLNSFLRLKIRIQSVIDEQMKRDENRLTGN
ncbi:MAG TPA: hypothetical protein VG537_04435 [Candidatus Kapabacteria bacterium]|jgi:hypothetical protein|nr:hypothetical protein [Candidatus Kapabacteria bacterium]